MASSDWLDHKARANQIIDLAFGLIFRLGSIGGTGMVDALTPRAAGDTAQQQLIKRRERPLWRRLARGFLFMPTGLIPMVLMTSILGGLGTLLGLFAMIGFFVQGFKGGSLFGGGGSVATAGSAAADLVAAGSATTFTPPDNPPTRGLWWKIPVSVIGGFAGLVLVAAAFAPPRPVTNPQEAAEEQRQRAARIEAERVAAQAQKCDPSVPGNSKFPNAKHCWDRVAEGNGIVISLPSNSTLRVDMSKVPACTAIGALLIRRMGVTQTNYLGTEGFISTFMFSSKCVQINLDCQVLETGNHPILNKPPSGTVSMTCDASTARYTEALRILVPSLPAGKATPFVSQCLVAAKAGKTEGPVDFKVGSNMLICDPQHPEGPNVSVLPID
jgi:hypothetical protein